MASIFRGPLYSARPRVRDLNLGWTQNLLESTLGVASPSAPFDQVDWPNPTRRWQGGETTVAANLLLTVLAVAAIAAPFAQEDWPNPRALPARQESQTAQNLLATTLAQVQQAPFVPEDWPNPVRRDVRQESQTAQNLLATTLAVVQPAPFSQLDWPVYAPRKALDLSYPPNLADRLLAPFVPEDWPNPTGRVTRQEAGTTQNLLATTLGAQPAPFAQIEWPNPGRNGGVSKPSDPPNLLGTTLAPIQQAPFVPEDWPTPFAKRGGGQTNDPPNLIGVLLTAPTGQAPFAQLDWPNPAGRVTRQADGAPRRLVPGIIITDAVAWASSSSNAATVTSGSFDVPAGSLVVIVWESDGSTAPIPTISDNQAPDLAWQLITESRGFGTAAVSAWRFHSASAITGLTVTITRTSPLGVHSVKAYLISGHEPASPIGSAWNTNNTSTTNNWSPTTYTSSTDASVGMALGGDWNQLGLPTSTDIGSAAFPGNGIISLYKASPTTPPGTSVVFNFDAFGASAPSWRAIAWEIKPAGSLRPFIPAADYWRNLARRAVGQDSLTAQSLLQTTLAPTGQAPFAQSQWPNPVLKNVGVGESYPQTPLGIQLVPASGSPFVPEDWPNPTVRPASRADSVHQNLLATTLAGVQQAPFSQLDWKNPAIKGGGGQTNDQVNLIALLATAPPGTPFHQLDWPTPVAKRGGGRTDDPPNLIGTVLGAPVQKPFSQSAWPNPAGRVGGQDLGAQNLIATTLAPTGQAPFSQSDWPNPQMRAAGQQFGAQDLLATTLFTIPAVGNPFSANDWPNPIVRPAIRLDAGVGINRVLLGSPAAAAPLNQLDWPNPFAKRGGGQTNDPPNLTGRLLAPFAQLDWPNPAAKRAARDEAGTAQGLLATTLVQRAPFAQLEWPNPGGLKVRTTRTDDTQNLIGTGLLASPPFSQSDWPTPVAKRGGGQTNDPPNLTDRLLAPFGQKHWPNPTGRKAQRYENPPQDLLATTLFTTPAGKPFLNSDWPNPRIPPPLHLGVQGRNRLLFEAQVGRLVAEINLYAALNATIDVRSPGATTRIN